jgi:hypothetical protein
MHNRRKSEVNVERFKGLSAVNIILVKKRHYRSQNIMGYVTMPHLSYYFLFCSTVTDLLSPVCYVDITVVFSLSSDCVMKQISQVEENLYKTMSKAILVLFRDRVVQYFAEICGLIMKISGFGICGLAHPRNLRICHCGMSPRISGFAI